MSAIAAARNRESGSAAPCSARSERMSASARSPAPSLLIPEPTLASYHRTSTAYPSPPQLSWDVWSRRRLAHVPARRPTSLARTENAARLVACHDFSTWGAVAAPLRRGLSFRRRALTSTRQTELEIHHVQDVAGHHAAGVLDPAPAPGRVCLQRATRQATKEVQRTAAGVEGESERVGSDLCIQRRHLASVIESGCGDDIVMCRGHTRLELIARSERQVVAALPEASATDITVAVFRGATKPTSLATAERWAARCRSSPAGP